MRAKSARPKPYKNLPSLPIPSHNWKDLTMDCVKGLPPSKVWKYDSILTIVDSLTKAVLYEAV